MGGCLLIYRLSVSFADRSPFLCFAFCELFTSGKRLNCNNGLIECKILALLEINLLFLKKSYLPNTPAKLAYHNWIESTGYLYTYYVSK